MIEFEAVFAKGTIENLRDCAVLIKSDCNVIENLVQKHGATEIAENMGLYKCELVSSIYRRKYKNGTYRVTGHVHNGDFENVEIEAL